MNKFFRKSCDHFSADWPSLDDTWAQSMELWVLNGIPPGSFLEAVLANDLQSAALRSHPANTWESIMSLARWLLNVAPKECYGSYDNLKKWQALSNDQRMEKCIAVGLMPTAWEILNNDPKWMFYGTEP